MTTPSENDQLDDKKLINTFNKIGCPNKNQINESILNQWKEKAAKDGKAKVLEDMYNDCIIAKEGGSCVSDGGGEGETKCPGMSKTDCETSKGVCKWEPAKLGCVLSHVGNSGPDHPDGSMGHKSATEWAEKNAICTSITDPNNCDGPGLDYHWNDEAKVGYYCKWEGPPPLCCGDEKRLLEYVPGGYAHECGTAFGGGKLKSDHLSCEQLTDWAKEALPDTNKTYLNSIPDKDIPKPPDAIARRHGLSKGAIAGIVIGSIVGAAAIATGIYYLIHRRQVVAVPIQGFNNKRKKKKS